MMLESDKKILVFLKKLLPYILIVILVTIEVEGTSMYSTLDDNEILLLKKYDKNYKRFDVIVFDYNGERLIKRVIGLPSEKVKYKSNKLYINGKKVKEDFLKNNQKTYDFDIKDLGYETIPKNCYFVLGDNRTNSTDSRVLGPICKEQISGKTDFVLFPFNRFGKFN